MMTDTLQTWAFTSARLTAPAFYKLLGNLSEIQLTVTAPGEGELTGIGYRREVAEAFGKVIYDWRAVTRIAVPAELAAGTYELSRRGAELIAHTDEGTVVLPDGAGEVELTKGGEEE